jgi:AcrR family transcriptional regulator
MPRPRIPLLSREVIVARSLEIIDADGASGLTMRKLAADLGVQGASLYHHFRNKGEILDAITDQIYAKITLKDSGGNWERVLSDYAYQLRALLGEHPYVVEFMALRPLNSESALRNYEHFARELSGCGWTPRYGREVLIALENLVFGATLMRNSPDLVLSPEEASAYPLLAQAVSGPRTDPDDGFELGFEAFINGLRGLTPRDFLSGQRPAPDELAGDDALVVPREAAVLLAQILGYLAVPSGGELKLY